MLVTKATAAIQPGVDDSESPNGTFDIILSAQTRDRDGDVFKADEWKQPLPEWIPIDIDHAMSVEKTVGSGHPFINDDGDLQVRGSYASTPLAQLTRTLVNERHCRHVSVAVMVDKSLKDGTPNRELLNGAFVAVPSNREAVVLASKSLAVGEDIEVTADGQTLDPAANVKAALGHVNTYTKAGARNSQADSKMIQAIHDAASLLGAACISEAAPDSGDGADEGANKAVRQTIVVGKGLTGSVEDLRDRLSDALQDVVGDGGWVWVRATFLDAGGRSGTVVYDLGDETYSRTFTDEDGLITLGTSIECVTIVTAVKPADPQVDDDPSDAVEGAADEHDPDEKSHPKDIAAFAAALDALTKSSGDNAGSPDSSAEAPAEPPADAAPQGPADAAGEAADKAAEEMAQKMAAEMLAGTFSAQVTLSTLEP